MINRLRETVADMADKFREEPSSAVDFRERLKVFRESLGVDQRALAKLSGTAFRTYQDYELGKSPPKVAFLQKLVALGCDPAWLLSPDADAPKLATGLPAASGAPPKPIDPELFARVLDAIAQLYKSEGLAISLSDLGRLAAPRYDEIVISTDDPTERIAMIKLMLVQLRGEIRAAEAEPGKGKSSA